MQGSLSEGKHQLALGQLLFKLQLLLSFLTKQGSFMIRSTVLSLPLQLVFANVPTLVCGEFKIFIWYLLPLPMTSLSVLNFISFKLSSISSFFHPATS